MKPSVLRRLVQDPLPEFVDKRNSKKSGAVAANMEQKPGRLLNAGGGRNMGEKLIFEN